MSTESTPFARALVEGRDRKRDKTSPADQKDLAAAIGVSQAAISQWESGASMPRAWRVKSIARAYGLRPARLMALWLESMPASRNGRSAA